MNSIEFEKAKWTPGDVPLFYSKTFFFTRILKLSLSSKSLQDRINEEANKLASQFIFSDRGRKLNTIINDNQGQMSANALMREVFLAGFEAGRLL